MAPLVHESVAAEVLVRHTAYACDHCEASSVTIMSLFGDIEDEKFFRALEVLGWIQVGAEWFCLDCVLFSREFNKNFVPAATP